MRADSNITPFCLFFGQFGVGKKIKKSFVSIKGYGDWGVWRDVFYRFVWINTFDTMEEKDPYMWLLLIENMTCYGTFLLLYICKIYFSLLFDQVWRWYNMKWGFI